MRPLFGISFLVIIYWWGNLSSDCFDCTVWFGNLTFTGNEIPEDDVPVHVLQNEVHAMIRVMCYQYERMKLISPAVR